MVCCSFFHQWFIKFLSQKNRAYSNFYIELFYHSDSGLAFAFHYFSYIPPYIIFYCLGQVIWNLQLTVYNSTLCFVCAFLSVLYNSVYFQSPACNRLITLVNSSCAIAGRQTRVCVFKLNNKTFFFSSFLNHI